MLPPVWERNSWTTGCARLGRGGLGFIVNELRRRDVNEQLRRGINELGSCVVNELRRGNHVNELRDVG